MVTARYYVESRYGPAGWRTTTIDSRSARMKIPFIGTSDPPVQFIEYERVALEHGVAVYLPVAGGGG